MQICIVRRETVLVHSVQYSTVQYSTVQYSDREEKIIIQEI